MDFTLYQFATCPYCAKVRKALRTQNVPFGVVEVDREDKSVLTTLGATTVPTIVHGNVHMSESSDIVQYITDTF